MPSDKPPNSQKIIDFEQQLNQLYIEAKTLQPIHDRYMELCNRIIKTEHIVQGLHEARERYELGERSKPLTIHNGQKPKSVLKNTKARRDTNKERELVAKFRSLSPEQQAKLGQLMESK